MGRTRSIGRGIAAVAGLVGSLASGCQLAPAKVWNLEQVHASDGRPKNRGRLVSDFGFLLARGISQTNFGGPEFRTRQEKDERIDDPLGTCLENVSALASCERDEKVVGLQAAAFSWLGVDCTYLLSRERCVLELGELAQVLGLGAAPLPPSGAPATPEDVHEAFEELTATVREVLAAPDRAGTTLSSLCERISAFVLDRPGALRLLRGANALLAEDERGAVLAPLRTLRLELARRCTTLALQAALEDPHGRVRAAALESCLLAFPAERAQRLRWALTDPMQAVEARDEVSLRALELVARYGLPPPPEDEQPADFERAWREVLVQILRLQVDGPHSMAACRALAKLTGEPATLRAEVWLARWRRDSAGADALNEPSEGAPGPDP